MDNQDGVRLVLSPVQMAALLSDKSVSEGETLSNRLYGGLGLAEGLLNLSNGLTMKNINVHVLDSLIAIYFGQDYDLFGSGESVDTQIDVWIADTPSATRHGLIGDIDQFIQESDNLEDDFESRYGNEFSAQLWDTTPANFLSLLRQKVIDSLS